MRTWALRGLSNTFSLAQLSLNILRPEFLTCSLNNKKNMNVNKCNENFYLRLSKNHEQQNANSIIPFFIMLNRIDIIDLYYTIPPPCVCCLMLLIIHTIKTQIGITYSFTLLYLYLDTFYIAAFIRLNKMSSLKLTVILWILISTFNHYM